MGRAAVDAYAVRYPPAVEPVTVRFTAAIVMPDAGSPALPPRLTVSVEWPASGVPAPLRVSSTRVMVSGCSDEADRCGAASVRDRQRVRRRTQRHNSKIGSADTSRVVDVGRQWLRRAGRIGNEETAARAAGCRDVDRNRGRGRRDAVRVAENE